MQIPETPYFTMQEFLPKEEYARLCQIKKDSQRLAEFYKLVNPKIVLLADFLRQYFDRAIIINTWHKKIGGFNYRGWRPKNCTVGARFSEHKNGNAIDFDVVGLTDNQVKDIIKDNEPLFYAKGVRRMEDMKFSPSWTHLDLKEVPNYKDKVYIFVP